LSPKPADALYYKEGESTHIIRQTPVSPSADCACDLPSGLLLVEMRRKVKGKPVPGPQYWPLQRLIEWGEGQSEWNKAQETEFFDALEKEGQDSLDIETRIHVALDRETGASVEGQLFQTGGIDLSARRQGCVWAKHDLVFIGRAAAELRDDLVNLGGERRLSRLHAAAENVWPAPPQTLAENIRRAGGLRLTLVTPALFSEGYRPGWLDETLTGSPPGISNFRLRLRAVAVERWVPVSGWDLAARKPRATRKAVAAGAVYWFECIGEIPEDFIQQLWLRPLSDQEQDRRDGFGLTLPAPWTPIAGNE
jgi:CRISPR-associated protein Cmr3